MQLNDGKGKYPFADDCDRLENGRNDDERAGPGRRAQARSEDGHELFGHVDLPRAVRVGAPALREQAFEIGAMWPSTRSMASWQRSLSSTTTPAESRHFETPDGRKVTAGPQEPWTWHIAEVFKVEKGLLHEIEAVLARVPYGMGSGWSNRKDAMSDRIQFEK